MVKMSVRVRFAPSPTGTLHVGAFRDALFKFLYARHTSGTNILRIEDTDRTRYNPESEQEFIDTLAWGGIIFDEGPHIGGPFAPYRQSERKEEGIYAKWIDHLLGLGGAYYAFDTPEELVEMREFQRINHQPTGYFGGEWRDASQADVDAAKAQGKPYVIRQKVRRDRTISIQDVIRGEIQWDSNTIDDPVLIKADGMPTYHFASMVDDHLMDITHIMRGEEWISSAPKHAELFDLFGWERPIFVHCPVIVGNDGKKLSKRHGATRVLDYASEGYLPHSLKNFVALIGWSPGDDREAMSEQELVDTFDITHIQASPGRFQLEKLKWLNGIEIRNMSVDELSAILIQYINDPLTAAYWLSFVGEVGTADEKIDGKRTWQTLKLLGEHLESEPDYAISAIRLEQERVLRLSEFGEACSFFFEDPVTMDLYASKKWLAQAYVHDLFNKILEKLPNQRNLTESDCEDAIKEIASELGFEKLGPVVHPTRVALTGRTFGPGLWELMTVLGYKRIERRLHYASQVGADMTI